MSRRGRPLWLRLIAGAFVLGAVGGMAEVGARKIGAEIPEWKLVDADGVVMTGHPSRLWGLSPGLKRNGDTEAVINALGMRGAMPTQPKPAGLVRVLLVGDSTFFGHGVDDDSTFPAQLEQRLRARLPRVEVLNAAVPGYSTEQTRIQMDEDGWALDPDLLIIGNLWSDNNIDSFRDQDLLETVRACRDNPLYGSAFFRLLTGAVDRARGGTGARLVTWTRDSQFPTHGGRRVSLKRYAENLDSMVREAATRGIGSALISPSNLGQVRGDFPEGASWDPFFAAQGQLATFHHIPVIRTLPAMRAAVGADATLLFVDVMHPSTAGHAVFAATADSVLAEVGWPTNRLLATDAIFPADTLVDTGFATGKSNPSSPQRNLFVGTDLPGPGLPPQRPGSSAGGAGAPAVVSPSLNGGTLSGATEGRSWGLAGTVRGGTGPFRITVQRPDGRAVSNVWVAAPGPFRVNVRGDLEAVVLEATDAEGRTAKGSAGRKTPFAELIF